MVGDESWRLKTIGALHLSTNAALACGFIGMCLRKAVCERLLAERAEKCMRSCASAGDVGLVILAYEWIDASDEAFQARRSMNGRFMLGGKERPVDGLPKALANASGERESRVMHMFVRIIGVKVPIYFS